MNKKHRVAVIGHTGQGNYGHGLDRVWNLIPECELVAVADPDTEGREAAQRRLGVSQGFADWRQMLDEVQPEFVSICPRWINRHHEYVMECAERGIHMYLEKPFCRDLTEADQMVAACEQHGAKLAIAFQTRYSPRLTVVRQLIEEDAIGEVLELRGRGKEDARGGGEDLWVLGSHIMNLIHHLGGYPRWCMADVQEQGQPVRKQHVVDGPEGIGPLAGDTVHAMYGMNDGVTAYFASSREAGVPGASRFGLQIFGSHGIVELTTGYLPQVHLLRDPAWSPGRSSQAWVAVTSAGVGEKEPLEFKDNNAVFDAGNVAACRDLIAAVEEDRQPEASVYEARTSVEMIAAVFEAHRQGQTVELPLQNRANPLTRLPA